jgi:hypothetical protein
MKRTETQNLEHIIRRMQTDSSIDAPVEAIRYAKNLYRTRAAEPKASVLQRALAVLRVDLAPNRAAFGERSASAGQARQMLFETGDNAVDLRITASENEFEIRGQILGAGFENSEVEIKNEQVTATTKTGKMSEFTLACLPAGEYTMAIRGVDNEISIDPLTLS